MGWSILFGCGIYNFPFGPFVEHGPTGLYRPTLLVSNRVFLSHGCIWIAISVVGRSESIHGLYSAPQLLLQPIPLRNSHQAIQERLCPHLQGTWCDDLGERTAWLLINLQPITFTTMGVDVIKIVLQQAIEESRVTRGIGRCRNSSNFSNRQTAPNTGSLTDKVSKDGQPCICHSGWVVTVNNCFLFASVSRDYLHSNRSAQ